jgi:hypothetical protein
MQMWMKHDAARPQQPKKEGTHVDTQQLEGTRRYNLQHFVDIR